VKEKIHSPLCSRGVGFSPCAGSNNTQILWIPCDPYPSGQSISKGPGSWYSVESVQNGYLTQAQPKGCTSACFLLAETSRVGGRGYMVSEASRSIRVATSEMKKPSELQHCSSHPSTQSLPSVGSSQRPSVSTCPPQPCLLYCCLPCGRAAFGLTQLVVHSSSENVSVLLCLSRSMSRLWSYYILWQF